MGTLSIILGILGLIGTIVSLVFAIVVYVSPMFRFKLYLRNKNAWVNIHLRAGGDDGYLQHSRHPEFTITESEDSRKWDRDEPWMKKTIRPDKNSGSRKVYLNVSGVVVWSGDFMFLDGYRIYVPVPKVDYAETENEEDNTYYYDEVQILVANVIGKFHIYNNLNEFCSKTGICMSH
jgi:hypothetical protein